MSSISLYWFKSIRASIKQKNKTKKTTRRGPNTSRSAETNQNIAPLTNLQWKTPLSPPNAPLTIVANKTGKQNRNEQNEDFNTWGWLERSFYRFPNIILFFFRQQHWPWHKKKSFSFVCFSFQREHNIYKNTQQQQWLLRAINSVPRQTFCRQININEGEGNDPISSRSTHTGSSSKPRSYIPLFQNIETDDENNVYTGD